MPREKLERLLSMRRTLGAIVGSGETYLDLTNRSAQYFYLNYPPPIPVTAPYKLGLFQVLSGRRSQIEFPTVEVDGVDEVLLIAETARRGLDPLNP